MPQHALYYPEWEIRDPLFLAESLLYWDRIACIVPFQNFKLSPIHKDKEIQKVLEEVHEQFVFQLVPTEEQKKRAHERIKNFAEHDPPDWCRPENLKPQQRQIFSAYKFAPETVELLRERGWATQLKQRNRLNLQLIADAAADMVIGALVDECSSPTMPPITDDPGSFTANCNLLLHELGSTSGITTKKRSIQPSKMPIESDFSFLLAKIPHLSLNSKTFDAGVLRHILQARNNPEIEHQRESFRKKVDEYLEKIRTVEEPERQLVREEFVDQLKIDIKLLQRELRLARIDSILSKEGVVAVILGVLTGTLNPVIGTAFGIVGELLVLRQKRQGVFERRWSSWIFSATTNRLKFW